MEVSPDWCFTVDDTIGSLTVNGGSVINGGTLGLNGDVTVLASGGVTAGVDLGLATRTFAITNSGTSLQVIGSISGKGLQTSGNRLATCRRCDRSPG